MCAVDIFGIFWNHKRIDPCQNPLFGIDISQLRHLFVGEIVFTVEVHADEYLFAEIDLFWGFGVEDFDTWHEKFELLIGGFDLFGFCGVARIAQCLERHPECFAQIVSQKQFAFILCFP